MVAAIFLQKKTAEAAQSAVVTLLLTAAE